MSVSVDFIYDPECPNAKTARANLMTALSRAGVAPRWVEHLAGAPSTPVEVRSFGSPTVLVDGRDVAGDAPASSVHTRMSSSVDVCCAWRKSGARVINTFRPSAPKYRHWKKQNPNDS